MSKFSGVCLENGLKAEGPYLNPIRTIGPLRVWLFGITANSRQIEDLRVISASAPIHIIDLLRKKRDGGFLDAR
jgi:hypothetical protein